MHEFSTAQQVIRTVLRVAGDEGVAKVVGIELELGGLSHLNEEQLQFSLGVLAEGTPAEGARVKIKYGPIVFKCKRCGFKEEKVVSGVDFFELLVDSKCRRCGERVKVDGETGCMIKSIRGKK